MSFNADYYLLKDRDLKITQKRNIAIFFNSVIQKKSLRYIYKFIIIHRSSTRKAEKKPVSFYMIHNLLYETSKVEWMLDDIRIEKIISTPI